MDDLISRQAALDMIHSTFSKSLARQRAEECIKKVPSAQPEKRTEKRTETHACDLISRQAAIDAVNKREWLTQGAKEILAEVIEQLPSAQPLVLTCDGCRHVGTYDTDFPCSGCIRREKDYYEQER